MELKVVLRVAHNKVAFNTIADALTNYKQLLADNMIYLCDIKTLRYNDLPSYLYPWAPACTECTCKQIVVETTLINLATSLATSRMTTAKLQATHHIVILFLKRPHFQYLNICLWVRKILDLVTGIIQDTFNTVWSAGTYMYVCMYVPLL